MPSSDTDIGGYAAEGFSPVVDVFRANLADGRDVGAACTVYLDGQPVVDVWGGQADPRTGKPWDEDTLTGILSITKGLVAILAHQAVEAGLLDLDAPVANYWPEFAQAGKADIPLRWLLSHRDGLLALDRDLTLDEALAWTPVVEALEAQEPLWPPGTAWAYHSMTFGWLVGEVLRRVTGRTPGALLRERIAEPLGADVWLGLPEAQAHRVAPKIRASNPVPVNDPTGLVKRARTLGSAFVDEASLEAGFNDPRVQGAEVPAVGGVGTARAVAKAFAATVSDVDGVRLLRPSTLGEVTGTASESPSWLGNEAAVERFSTGFMLDCPGTPLLGPASFGHRGAGGLLAFADAEHRVAFCYVVSQIGGVGDSRARRLVGALRSCLGVAPTATS